MAINRCALGSGDGKGAAVDALSRASAGDVELRAASRSARFHATNLELDRRDADAFVAVSAQRERPSSANCDWLPRPALCASAVPAMCAKCAAVAAVNTLRHRHLYAAGRLFHRRPQRHQRDGRGGVGGVQRFRSPSSTAGWTRRPAPTDIAPNLPSRTWASPRRRWGTVTPSDQRSATRRSTSPTPAVT